MAKVLGRMTPFAAYLHEAQLFPIEVHVVVNEMKFPIRTHNLGDKWYELF